MTKNYLLRIALVLFYSSSIIAQENDSLLSLERIYSSSEFNSDDQRPIFWIENGDAFVSIEKDDLGNDELIRYESKNHKSNTYLSAKNLAVNGKNLVIEDFSLSPDGSKVLIFTNTSRVWRSNTKGDFWVYDFDTKELKQLGKDFPSRIPNSSSYTQSKVPLIMSPVPSSVN